MSNIHEALKRAQQERDRLRGAAPDAAPPATPTPLTSAFQQHLDRAAPAAASPAPQANASVTTDSPASANAAATSVPIPEVPHTPLMKAIKQGVVSSADKQASRITDTIVEDYESKRKLHLPPAVVVYHDRSGHIAEQYRRIRNNLLADGKTGPRLYVITSSVPGEGKTITTLNLGLSTVELRSIRVLLVDADLHRTTLSSHLKLHMEKGLSEILSTAAEADTFIKPTPWNNLFVLPAGATMPPKLATDLLRTPHARTILRYLRNRFDVVLIDTPAAGKCPDAGILGSASDGVLLTVSLRHTSQAHVQRTVRLLESLNIPVKGTVLTRNGG